MKLSLKPRSGALIAVISTFAAATLTAHLAQAGWLVREVTKGGRTQILSVDRVAGKNTVQPQTMQSLPAFLREDAPSPELFQETLYSDKSLPSHAQQYMSLAAQKPDEFPGSETRTLVLQGPKENRINLTILGDGYTAAEKEKFFADADRTTHELFTGATFASYLPLFNVYAVFTPSPESGISDTEKKNTVFGLYRDPPGSKRAIMPGNTEVLEDALKLSPATDFPIVLANDDFYGGLGGRYAISTRSVESGIIVLRHELGHNFGGVGEEYDSGYVYMGANSSSSADVPWKQWLPDGVLKVYETLFISGDYVWQNLGNSPYSADFEFPAPTNEGGYEFEIIISSVGWKTPDDVTVELDGQAMALEGKWTVDRSFFTFHLLQSPAPGKHTLTVRQNKSDGDKVLAFAEIYAQPAGFDWTADKIAAFATYNADGRKMGYRPTHTGCLMRDMTTPKFCSVDLENMWIRFLNRVSLIDGLSYDTKTRTVALSAPAIKGLTVRWYTVDPQGQETEMTELAGKNSWINSNGIQGTLRAKVQFRTSEVRNLTSRFDAQKDLTL